MSYVYKGNPDNPLITKGGGASTQGGPASGDPLFATFGNKQTEKLADYCAWLLKRALRMGSYHTFGKNGEGQYVGDIASNETPVVAHSSAVPAPTEGRLMLEAPLDPAGQSRLRLYAIQGGFMVTRNARLIGSNFFADSGVSANRWLIQNGEWMFQYATVAPAPGDMWTAWTNAWQMDGFSGIQKAPMTITTSPAGNSSVPPTAVGGRVQFLANEKQLVVTHPRVTFHSTVMARSRGGLHFVVIPGAGKFIIDRRVADPSTPQVDWKLVAVK